MSDLSQSLIDAAAEAFLAAAPRYGGPEPDQVDDEQRAMAAELATDAVVAVLEALAIYCDPVETGEDESVQKLLTNTDLRHWAAEVRESCGERFGATGVCDMPKGHAPISEVMGWMHSETLRGGERP